jgi:hypothetical protein
MTSLDRANVRQVAEQALAVLREHIGRQTGLAIEYRGGLVNGTTSAVLKFEFSTTSESGAAQNRERHAFVEHAQAFGLSPTSLDETFTSRGEAFRIIGLKPGAPKRALIAIRLRDDRRFAFPPEAVRRALASPQAA